MFSLQNVFVGSEGVRMAFSPNESRQSGGGLLVLAFSDETPLRVDAEFFVALEGKSWRHLVTTKRVNNVTFHSHIPENKSAETVRLSILSSREGITKTLASSSFRYNPEGVQRLAEYLVNSVYDVSALESTDRVKAEYKEVFREDIQIVDRKLCKILAQQLSRKPDGWNILYDNSGNGKGAPAPQETLLHLCARLGLRWTAQYLLGQPGGSPAKDLPNIEDDTPTDLSNMYGNIDMAEMFSGRPPSWGDPPWREADSPEGSGPPTRIRRVDRDQFVLTTNLKTATTTLYADLSMLQEVVISRRFPPPRPLSRNSSQSTVSSDGHHAKGLRPRSKSGVTVSRVRPRDGVIEGVRQETLSDADSDELDDSPFHGNHPTSHHGNHHQHQHRYARTSHPTYQKLPPQPTRTPLQNNYLANQNTPPVTMDTHKDKVAMETNPGYVSLEPHLSSSFLHRLSPSVSGGGGGLEHGRRSSAEWNKPVLEESLKKLQEIHTTLQQKLRVAPGGLGGSPGGHGGSVGGSFRAAGGSDGGSYSGNKENQEDSRAETLNRFSTSCPSLPDSLTLSVVQSQDSTALTNHDPDHHKSLSNLEAGSVMPDGGRVRTVTHQHRTGTSPPHHDNYANLNMSAAQDNNNFSSQVKIYINDVDTSGEDFLPPSGVAMVTDGDPSNEPSSGPADLIEQIKRANRRRSSWCPEEGRKRDDKQEKRQMLNVSGRSQSLSSLDGDTDDDEDDDDDDDANSSVTSSSAYGDTQTDGPAGRYTGSPHQNNVYSSSPHQNNVYSSSPRYGHEGAVYSSGSNSPLSHNNVMLDRSTSPGYRGDRDRQVGPSATIMSPGSSHHTPPHAPGAIITTVTPTGLISSDISTATTASNPATDAANSTQHGLMYPSTLSKAASTPSIATGSNQDSPPVIGSFTESIKMTGAAPSGEDSREETEIKAEWFRSQPPGGGPLDAADLGVTAEEEEERPKLMEKKRKTSVFAKFGSYRQKRVPTKDLKLLMNSHQFVTVSVSNATLCDVCSKSMANKAALQCENCIVNVHENTCKDQISPCAKFKMTRTSNGDSVKDKSSSLPESVTLSTNLKASQSFKERRSISVPARPVLQVSNSTSALPRSNSPSNGGHVASSGGSFQWRRVANRLGIDRVINEEREKVVEEPQTPTPTSAPATMHLLDTTNITDALSVSLESLDEASTEVADIVEDYEPEPEAWSVTVDKKTLKKMSAKDIKRQDHIWELIQTERSHCRTLQIMQKIFSRGMRQEVGMSQDMIDRIFPRLAELQDIHTTFLHRLRERQKLRADRHVDDIGDVLNSQFDLEMGERMKQAYGDFCSRHAMAVQLYKDILKSDRKFQAFIKKCSRSTICKRLSIPECILLVTQRVTKYPLLIEPIIKTTKDNKSDKDQLTRALSLMRDVLNFIDAQVDAHEKYQRLLEIYNKLDARSSALYLGDKFKKSNLLGTRKLIHEGYMKWMTARGKSFEVLAVILSDVMFFLAENNQKFTFFSQDSKSSVVPLSKLLVREKSDTRDSKGIYLICQSKTQPEMYEFVCRSADDRKAWISIIKKAIMTCMEAEGATVQKDRALDVDRRELEAKSARIRQLIDRLYRVDGVIRQHCDDKMSVVMEMLEVFCKDDLAKNLTSLYREDEGPDSIDLEVFEILKTALKQGSLVLSSLLPGGGSPSLARSMSSVGERADRAPHAPSLPKRAETFSGFDQREKIKKRYNSGQLAEGDSGSDGQLNESVSDLSKEAPAATSDREKDKISSRVAPTPTTTPTPTSTAAAITGPASFLQALLNKTADVTHTDAPRTDGDDHTALTNMAAGLLTTPSREQCESLAQLMQYLHGLVCITSHQVTEVEKFRAQLSEANTKVSSLYAENKKLSHGYHHDKQLEILREQQETIRHERAEFEKFKSREQQMMAQDRAELSRLREDVDKQKADLRRERDEIHLQKEILQRQMDLFEEQRRRLEAAAAKPYPLGPGGLRERSESPVSSRGVSPGSRSASQASLIEVSHKRSASDDLSPEARMIRRPDPQLPIHLLSATNEQKLVTQQIPVKLLSGKSSPVSTATMTTSTSSSSVSAKQMLPFKLSGGQSVPPSSQRSSSPRQSPAGRAQGPPTGRPQPANVGRSSSSVRAAGNILPMKLAERPRPKSAGSSAGSVSVAGSEGQHSAARRTSSQSTATQPQKAEEEIIYF